MARTIIASTTFRAAAVVAAGLLCAAAPPGAALATAPSAEYGPEVEARFLQLCEADLPSTSPAACRQLSETLQTRLGYEAFLADAGRGPQAFAIAPAEDRRQTTAMALETTTGR